MLYTDAPLSLPRIEHHHEIQETHRTCGQAFKSIGEEVSEQHASRAGTVFCAAPYPRQVRLCVLPEHSNRADARTDHRQGYPGAELLAQVVVAQHDDPLPLYRQTEIYARSGMHIARSSGAVNRRVRAASGAAGPGVEGVHPQPQRGPRRRDAGGAAGTGQGHDEEGLCVGVPHDQLRAPARGVLRLLQRPLRRASAARLARVHRQAGERRLRQVSRHPSTRRDRRILQDSRQAQALRGTRRHRQRDPPDRPSRSSPSCTKSNARQASFLRRRADCCASSAPCPSPTHCTPGSPQNARRWPRRTSPPRRRLFARGHRAEFDRVGKAQWPRSLGLSQGCVRALPTLKDRDLAQLLPHNWRATSVDIVVPASVTAREPIGA